MSHSNSTKQYHLFDLDHTLLQVNSSFRFGIYLYRERLLPFTTMIYLLACYGFHKLGLLTTEQLHTQASQKFFYGRSLSQLKSYVHTFLDRELEGMKSGKVLSVLHSVQTEGHFTAILSNSPAFLVEEVARRMGVDTWAGTDYEVGEGDSLGKPLEQMIGVAKARFVRELQVGREVDQEDVFAYTDSILDLPFLEAVGNPVAVNPDAKLRKLCGVRGWRVL